MLVGGGLRGMEDFLVDMVANKKIAHALIQRVHDMMLSFAERALVGPNGRPDLIRIGSDFASATGLTISLATFRELFLPRIRELIELIHRHGALVFFHCCAAMSDLLPDLIDAGIDILDPVQTVLPGMEPERLKREYGTHVAFYGGVDTMRLLPRGTPQEVREETRRLAGILGKGGGYIMAPCNGFRSDTPIDNILAFYEETGVPRAET
jgi:uroporphyrinogen decarboxylase